MVGTAMGLAARGAIPFPSTFACFLSRAYDFIRMAAISNLNIKLAGSHAGVSIGEDGPSQMALEDLAMMRAEPNIAVLYPCDAVSAERLVELAAYHPGPAYIRTSRPKTPVIYDANEEFTVGGLKVLRAERQRRCDGRRAQASRVFEALKAYDTLRGAGRLHPRDRPLLAAADRRGHADRRRPRDRRADRHGRGSLSGGWPRRRSRRRRRQRRPDRPSSRRHARFHAAAGRRSCSSSFGISASHVVDAGEEPHEKR